MSILSRILSDLVSLVAPRTCPLCGRMLHGQEVICSLCETMAPLTQLWLDEETPMHQRFWGLMPVERAVALLWYVEGSEWQDVVHRFKYGGQWRIAYNLGRWWGAILREQSIFEDVDMILPVPLHWRRRLSRGYNQSEELALGMAEELGLPVRSGLVRRSRYNTSQTSQSYSERWDNVEGIFSVSKAKELEGKHILLVDDVFTTGATIISLGCEILRVVPSARLSVATLCCSRNAISKG